MTGTSSAGAVVVTGAFGVVGASVVVGPIGAVVAGSAARVVDVERGSKVSGAAAAELEPEARSGARTRWGAGDVAGGVAVAPMPAEQPAASSAIATIVAVLWRERTRRSTEGPVFLLTARR